MKPHDDNTAAAKLAVACLYSVVPAALACVALPLLWKYPLTRARQERMRKHIERRDQRLQLSSLKGVTAPAAESN